MENDFCNKITGQPQLRGGNPNFEGGGGCAPPTTFKIRHISR